MKKQLQVRIFPDGKIDAKTLGIKGERCMDYMKLLEQLLDAQIVESTFTDEYHQSQTQEVSETITQKTKK